jgi:hypothetical protein
MSDPKLMFRCLPLAVLLVACTRPESEPTSHPVAQPIASATKPAAAAKKAEVVWTMPPSWKAMPDRPMRQATYQVPGSAGSDSAGPAEVAVFYFGVGQGGDVEANITRWLGQFKDLAPDQAERGQREVHGFSIATVRVREGTFSSGMPGGPTVPQEKYGLNAAVVETPAGPYFFKMTGPSATVDAEEGHFSEFLGSIQLAK